MRFSIDAIFIDNNNKAVEVIANMHPFLISGIYFRAHKVIELPAGTIKNCSVEIGNQLDFPPKFKRYLSYSINKPISI